MRNALHRARSLPGRPLRVLHVIDTLMPGGAERMVVELVNALDRSAVQPSVCVTRRGLALASHVAHDVEVTELGRQGTWSPAGFRRFAALVAHGSVDVLHAHGYSSARFCVAAQALSGSALPVLLHAHNSTPPGTSTRLVARLGVAHLVAVSAQQMDWARSLLGLTEAQLTLLPNAIDVCPYQQAAPLAVRDLVPGPPRFVGIIIANVRPPKDLATLFRALARSQMRDQVALLVAGSLENAPYVAACRTLVAELGLADRVVFLGPRSDVPRLLASVDFGVLSSSAEAGPLAVMEYMAASLPFVMTAVGHLGEVIIASGLQQRVPAGNAEGLAAALDALLALPPLARRERGSAGHALLHRHASIHAQCGRLQSLYERLVSCWMPVGARA